MSAHDRLLETAKKAADELFSDKSVSSQETFRSLADLRDHIEVMMESLPQDDEEF